MTREERRQHVAEVVARIVASITPEQIAQVSVLLYPPTCELAWGSSETRRQERRSDARQSAAATPAMPA